ncbi:MAG: glycoside hydrolase family 18 [Breznakibacter sp.]
MKRYLKFTLGTACLVSLLGMISCDDWTETESMDLSAPLVDEQNPALYQTYLQNLRSYKNSEHKYTYAWFDNSEKEPFSRAHHINVIPDSVDVIALMHPENLSTWEYAEMVGVRQNKGTRFLFTISFDGIKATYDELKKEHDALVKDAQEGDVIPEFPSFVTYLTNEMNASVQLVAKYNYDGISFSYLGKGILYMTDAEKVEYKKYHNLFVGVLKDWVERNSTKLFVFEGKPQNLLDKSILTSCKHIVLPCRDAKNGYQLDYVVQMASVEGVPADRFIIQAEMTSLDKADEKTGYWADGSVAIHGTSIWCASSHESYTIDGMGIYNVGNDYFSLPRLYGKTRSSIDALNPAVVQ